jgi:hypothetical protein
MYTQDHKGFSHRFNDAVGIGDGIQQQLFRLLSRDIGVASLLSGDFSDAGMLRIFQEGLANGNLTMPEVQRQMQLIPPDADGRRRYLQEHQDTSAQIETQLKERYGQTGSQVGPDGRTIGTVQQPARSGGSISSPPQQGAPLGMDPAQIAQYQLWLKSPRDYPDPANPTVTKHGTNETFQRDSGVPEKFIYPGGAPATPGTPPSPLGTGRPPATLLNPNKPQAAPAPAPTPTPSPAGTGISGPTPAQTATAAATVEQGKLGPPKFQQHADEDASAQSQQAILGTMLSDLNKFQSGSGAGKTLDIKRALTSWAPSVARSFNIKPDEVAGQESFDKLASQLALQQQGGTTDHRMDINAAANPHSSLSPEGADFIIRSLQGNSDYIRAKASLAAKWPDKANYPAFQESIKELDPRVFQMARMKDEQRQTYWKSLDTEAQKQIDAAGKKARELGVLGG